MSKKTIKILLVENNPDDAKLVREALVQAGETRFNLDWVDRLADGLEALQKRPPEAILLELNLLDGTGFDAIKNVHSLVPQIPIILLTGKDNEELADKMVQDGAQDYIIKGELNGSRLARSIRYAIERSRARRELAESESHYRDLFENAALAGFQSTPKGDVITVNQAFARMFGYESPHEVKALVRNAAEFFADPRRREEVLQQTAENPNLRTFENLYRRKDGSSFVGKLNVRPVKDPEGFVLYVEGFIEDLTERKLAEEALQASEERYRLLFELSPDAIGIYQAGRLIFINSAAAKLLGATKPEELIGRPMLDFVHPDYRELVMERSRQQLKEDKPVPVTEEKFIRLDGAVIDVDVTAAPIQFQAAPAIMVIVRDITERKQAEEQLQILKYSIDIAPDAAYWLDAEGHFLYINDIGCKSLGYSRDELLQMHVSDVNPRATRERWAQVWQELREKGSFTAESVHRRKDGREFPVEITSTYIKFGEKEYCNGFAKDITERKQAEGSLHSLFLRHEALLAAIPEIVMEVDNDKVYKWANQAGIDFFGEDVIGKQAAIYFEGEQTTYQDIQPLFNGEKQTVYLESWQRRKDGQKRLLAWWCQVLKDDTGNVTGAISSARDITEGKQVEERLRESEEQFRTFAQSAHDAILTINDQANIVFWNTAAGDLFGYPADEASGQSFLMTVPAGLREAVQAGFQRVIGSGNTNEVAALEETTRLRKDGSQFPAEVVLSSYMVKGKRFVTAIVHDITERKQVEGSLRENQARLDLALQSAGMGVWYWDLKENKFHFDKQTSRLLGINMEIYSGTEKEFVGTVHPDDQMLIKGALAQTIAKGKPYNPEYRVLWTDKSVHYITARGMLVRDESGQPARINGLLWEVSEKKQAELELTRQAEELTRLYRASTSLIAESTFDLPALAQTILKIVLEEFGQSNCSLFLIDTDSNKLTRLAAVGPYADQVSKVELTLDGLGLVPLAIHTGRCINTRDVTENPAYHPSWEMARSELTIPLKIGSRVIGVIDVQSAHPDFFSADDERLMTIFAERAALTLEHARLYSQTERRLENLTALRMIDTAIAGSFDVNLTLGIILDEVRKRLEVEATNVLIFSSATHSFRSAGGQAFLPSSLGQFSLRLGGGLADKVVRERQTLTIDDLSQTAGGGERNAELLRKGINSYIGVPLIAKGLVKGVLEIYHSGPISLNTEQLAFLDMVAGQAAIAIDSTQLFENLQSSNVELMMAYDETIEGWSQAMDLRDKETEGHSQRVAEIAVRLAGNLGFSAEELIHIRRGALLHDIGKIGVPDEILRKAGPLSEEEWISMRKHPQYAYDMLAPITYLHPAIDIPYCHHERWDGSGYPRGLKENQIPLAARIFAVGDVWDALTSDRPYRSAWSKEKALAYIQEQAGRQFDPRVVTAFIPEAAEKR